MRVGIRVSQKLIQCAPELWRRVEGHQAKRVDEYEPAEPLTVASGKTGCDGAAENLRDHHRRAWARRVEQPAQPIEHAIRSDGAAGHDRGAMTGKVGNDDPVGSYELRHDGEPFRSIFARPVQEYERWPITAFKHGGRDTGQVKTTLGDRHHRQQPRPRVVARDRAIGFRVGLHYPLQHFGHRLLLRSARRPDRRYDGGRGGASAKLPKIAPVAEWVVSATTKAG